MGDGSSRKRAAADSFGDHAEDYLESAVHGAGDDLRTIVSWCVDATAVLDVATGAGHTAGGIRAAGVPRVVAADVSPAMVATAIRAFDVEGVVADAERLPLADDAFDAVACRIAAHHFPDPERFLGEVARVLEPGGTFALEDNVAPDDEAIATFLNRVERLRDPTHERLVSSSAWRGRLEAAGFAVEESTVVSRTMAFDPWVERLDVPPDRRDRLAALFLDPPDGAVDRLGIVTDGDQVESWEASTLLARARLVDP